jgi:hypothetical protein
MSRRKDFWRKCGLMSGILRFFGWPTINRAASTRIFLTLFIFAILDEKSAASNLMRNEVTTILEKDKKIGSFEKFSVKGGIDITYKSNSPLKLYSYHIKNMDECNTVDFYQVENSPFVAVDGSCAGQGGQIHIYLFVWDKRFLNWCMRREIVGERADLPGGRLFSSEIVSRVTGCTVIGDTGAISYEAPKSTLAQVSERLASIQILKNNRELLKVFLASLHDFDISEIVNHINIDNLKNVNDLAFYMVNASDYYGAGQILSEIVEKFPGRVVAKLNLADAFWNIDGAKDKAKEMYQKYNEQMKDFNKEALIPIRAIERSK